MAASWLTAHSRSLRTASWARPAAKKAVRHSACKSRAGSTMAKAINASPKAPPSRAANPRQPSVTTNESTRAVPEASRSAGRQRLGPRPLNLIEKTSPTLPSTSP
jgi:hypothetical protein